MKEDCWLRTNPTGKRTRRPRLSNWISATTLSLTAFIYAILTFSLLLVGHYNSKEHGFALVTKNHYSWTYGPTAVLVFIVAIWRQVDYHCKAAIPWIILERGKAQAEQSLLLDYISPLQVVSFWQSLKNGHILVALTTIGFVLLKIATLASTGLLVEELVMLPSTSTVLPASTRFNGSLYNATDYIAKTDSSLVYTAYGIMAKGLAESQGTTDKLAYESFDVPPDLGSNNGYITAQVRAFVPNFNCEAATVSVNPSPYDANGTQTFDTMIINSPPCTLMGGSQPTFVLDPNTQSCPPRQLRGAMRRVNCSSDALADPFPNWQLLTLVEVSYNQTLINSTDSDSSVETGKPDVASWSLEIKQTTSLLCRPSYTLADINITYNLSQEEPQIQTSEPGITNATLENFHDEDLASMFTASLADASNMFGDFSDSELSEDFPDTMFKLMAEISGGRYQNLLDQQTMKTAAETTFQHIAVQIVSKNLLNRSNIGLDAEVTYLENRLQISAIPYWTMVSSFAALAALGLLMLCVRPRTPPPPQVETVLGIELVLVQSPALQRLVYDLKGAAETLVVQRLHGYLFSLQRTAAPNDQIHHAIQPHPEPIKSSTADRESIPAEGGANPFWKPLTVRRPVIVLILMLPPAAIVVLEILQRESDSNGGILTLPALSSRTVVAYTRLVPALIMLIIATSFNSVDFNMAILAPFNSMKTRPAPADRSIASSLVDKLPPLALWSAAKHGQYAAFCSAIAAIIGSVLTIVVSGLYTVEARPAPARLLLQGLDTFNTAWSESATNDNSAAVLTSLTESLNLTYPAFTYGELALPRVTPLSDVDNSTTRPLLQLSYPALRASLNCSVLAPDMFNVSATYNPRLESSSASIDAMIPLPPSCLLGGPGGNLSYIEIDYRVGFQDNTSYIGKLLDLHVGPYDAIQASAFGETDPTAQNDNPVGCPSIALIYGFVDVNSPEQTSVTTLMCYQVMQKVQTTTFFDLPAMSISSSKPPVPDESTIELLQSNSRGETSFSYRIQQHMDQSLSLFNQTEFASANLADTPVDGFFQGVLFGQTPLPATTLVGERNHDIIMRGINDFYRRYMAQAISANMRAPVNSSLAQPSSPPVNAYEGTILNASETHRLKQQQSAKLVLQILLGAMTVLGITAWRLTRLVDLVPYNPCTVFGITALLAGSKMCSQESMGTVQSDDHQAEAPSGRKYKLAWWDDINHDMDDQSDESSGEHASEAEVGGVSKRRYGIDVVDCSV